jgi:hypothetical protein
LRIVGASSEEEALEQIPKIISSLSYLEYLYIIGQNIKFIPISIKNLSRLIILDLWANPIKFIPSFLLEMENLRGFYLSGFNNILPPVNLLPFLKTLKYEKKIEIGILWHIIQENNERRQAELDFKQRKIQVECNELYKKYKQQENLGPIVYPPNEILDVIIKTNKDFEYLILWMLSNNFGCTWFDFKNEPLKISPATLSKYLNILIVNGWICKVSKGAYFITKLGKKKFSEIKGNKNY